MSNQASIELSESECMKEGGLTSATVSIRFDGPSATATGDRLMQVSKRLRSALVSPLAAIVTPAQLTTRPATSAPHAFPPQATNAIEWVRSAAEAGFRMLIVREPEFGAAGEEARRIEDEHASLLRVLHAIRFDAEMLGLPIAVSVGGQMLSTPAMAREFIDDCNSAWVGGCLCVSDPQVTSRPIDWVKSIGRRLFAIRVVGEATRSHREALRTISEGVEPSVVFVISMPADAAFDDLNGRISRS